METSPEKVEGAPRGTLARPEWGRHGPRTGAVLGAGEDGGGAARAAW